MANSKMPKEVSAGAYPFVLSNPAVDPNITDDTAKPTTMSHGSVKGRQVKAGAILTADAVEHIVKAVMDKDEDGIAGLEVTSR